MPTVVSNKNREQTGPSTFEDLRIVVLAGGVGGARMADGFAQLLPPGKLTIIVNTGDDFVHCGLTICPDLDTVLYTLAGIENPETGWGRAGETWLTLEALGQLAGPDWFRLGDLDLATHLARTQMLNDGLTLTRATQVLSDQLRIKQRILPMSDEPAPTLIDSDEGLLVFQEWFVARGWQPAVKNVVLPQDVKTTAQVAAALETADVVIFAPSNPFVSIDPILNVYPIREMIADIPQLVVAVSPIVGGKAVKGPAAKMMAELGLKSSPGAIAGYYAGLVDLFVYDHQDPESIDIEGLNCYQTDTLMANRDGRRKLALEVLNHILELTTA